MPFLMRKQWIFSSIKLSPVRFRHRARVRRHLEKLPPELPRDAAAIKNKLNELLESGRVACVRREDSGETLYYRCAQALLEEDCRGRVPLPGSRWAPPPRRRWFSSLRWNSSARAGRAKENLRFRYTWEIYKPATPENTGLIPCRCCTATNCARRMRVDRAAGALHINGLWLEEGFMPTKEFWMAFNQRITWFHTFIKCG